jgi:hypothetical protein
MAEARKGPGRRAKSIVTHTPHTPNTFRIGTSDWGRRKARANRRTQEFRVNPQDVAQMFSDCVFGDGGTKKEPRKRGSE